VVGFWQRQGIFLFFKNGPDQLWVPPICLLFSGYLVNWLWGRADHLNALVLRVIIVGEIPSVPLVPLRHACGHLYFFFGGFIIVVQTMFSSS